MTSPILVPLVKWSGGKSDEWANIVPHLPLSTTYSTYIEPFVGGGAIFFGLNPQRAVIADVHKELIDFYRAIGEGHANYINNFMTTHPNDEETYYKVRAYGYDAANPLQNAARFYYLRKTCYRGMLRYNSKGEFNIPFGRYKTCNYSDIVNPNYSELLARTEILNLPFTEIFARYNSADNFMFLDPPYDSEFTDYGYCQFDKEQHKQLAACFKSTATKCLMIIGKTDFITDLYRGYIVGEYEKKYRFKLHSGRVGDEINAVHLIIKNY